MNVITIDFETYYDRAYSLSKITTEAYVRDDLFEAIGVAVKVNDEETQWFSGTQAQTKRWLAKFDWDNSVAVAHNAMFDMAILNWHFDIRPKRIADTLSMLRAIDGPDAGNSLAKAAERYGLGVKGNEVVNALGKRRLDFSPEELARYGEYCINDVELTYSLLKLLAPLMPSLETRLIDLTIRMFSEPVLTLDKEVLTNHLSNVRKKKADLMAAVKANKESLMSNPKLAELLMSLGVYPPMKISPTTGKKTYAFAKSDEAFKALLDHHDPRVQSIVAARLGVKSTLEETRTERFIDIADRGTLPVPLRYYAVHTGRWGGDDKVNLQNLPRKSPLKKAILAPEGYVFIDCDSSQIEARTLAWLAGQQDLVDAFDRGEDVYKIMASSIYNVPVDKVTDDQRFVGKTTILGAGYGMGAGKFQAQLKAMGVSLDIDDCEYIIQVYRRTYPKIPQLWQQGNKALQALMTQRAAPLGEGEALQIDLLGVRLPNGMYIRYPNIREQQIGASTEIVYDTKKGRAVIPTRIYGGKCLAADTEALTSTGWKHITAVTMDDLLWDGVEWVKHDGLTYQGDKRTVLLDGVKMTPDHEVLTEEGWRCASSCEGLRRSDFRMPDGSEVRGYERTPFTLGVPLQVWQGSDPHRNGCGEARTQRARIFVRLRSRGQGQNARYGQAPSLLGVAFYAGQVQAAVTSGVEKLRRAGDYCVRSVGHIVRSVLGGYGTYLPAGTYVGPQGQQRGVFAGELPVGNLLSTGAEHSRCAPGGHEASGSSYRDTEVNAYVSVAPEPVYDILNAGPRSRFVVRGSSGPFIVHNCVENVCQALARIVIGEQMLAVARKLRVVMTVHDAVGALAPVEQADEARAYVEKCMRIRPKWAAALPLNCESKMGASYGG